MKKYLILILFFYCEFSIAQDVIFSQNFLVPETLNTSFTGTTRGTKTGAVFRSQWRSSALKVSSNFAFADTWFEGFKSGIGISVLNQKESGSSYTFNQINLGNSFLNTATIDPSVLKSQRSFFDISSSILFNNEDSWLGVTVRHLNKPNISLTEAGNIPLDVFFSAHGKYYLPVLNNIRTWLADKSKIYVLSNYMKQGPYNRFDAGLQYVFDDQISMGLTMASTSAKNTDNSKPVNSFSTFTGVHWQGYRFGYSYDFNTSELINTGGIHEFSISYDFNVNIRELNRYKCVPFF